MNSLPESLLRYRTELEDAVRRDLETQPRPSRAWGSRVLRPVMARPTRAAVVFAAVATAAFVALFVTTPWQSSPSLGFLEEVQAALTPPSGDRILHMKWDNILTVENPACTSTIRSELWIDLAPPHTYRAFGSAGGVVPEPERAAQLPPDPPTGGLDCRPPGSLAPVEYGGALDGSYPVMFIPPNSFARARRIYPYYEDPWAWVRQRISEGLAHMDGKAQLYGQTLERVRLDPPAPASCPAEAAGHCPVESDYVYFDPETFSLVVWDYARDPMYPLRRQRERYLEFEYLARTDDNLALTDIRAQHPDAVER